MARPSRNRNKTLSKSVVEIDLNSPYDVLHKLITSLNLKFDRDMGMLTGPNVKNTPDRKTLVELKENLKILHELIIKNIDTDVEKIESIRHQKEVTERNEISAENQNQNLDLENERNITSTETNEPRAIEKSLQQEESSNDNGNINFPLNTEKVLQGKTAKSEIEEEISKSDATIDIDKSAKKQPESNIQHETKDSISNASVASVKDEKSDLNSTIQHSSQNDENISNSGSQRDMKDKTKNSLGSTNSSSTDPSSPTDTNIANKTSKDFKTSKTNDRNRDIVFPKGPASHIKKQDQQQAKQEIKSRNTINDKTVIEESVKETVEENINERTESVDLNNKADDINPPEHELLTNVKVMKTEFETDKDIDMESNVGSQSSDLQVTKNSPTKKDKEIESITSEADVLKSKESSISDTVGKGKKRPLEETEIMNQQTKNKAGTTSPGKKKIKIEEADEIINKDIEQSTLKRLENDKRVKNPKSEFVISQTLPRAARALGLYTEDGLETTGEDYLKKKYNVASYPTTDLKELLPGELPDADFSMPKPTNQIQYNTFINFVDNFFRDSTDDDIKFLKEKNIIPKELQNDKLYDPDVTPFIIPKLGPLYTKVWIEEDNGTKVGNFSPVPLRDVTSVLPRRNGNDINDSMLDSEDVSCGPLLTRLLSAVLKDERDDQINNTCLSTPLPNMIHTSGDDKLKMEIDDNISVSSSTGVGSSNALDNTSEITNHTIEPNDINSISNNKVSLGGGTTSALKSETNWQINSVNLDYPTFEERLKRELKYVGIYMNLPRDINASTSGNSTSGADATSGGDPDWLYGREDDEVSAELRQLQSTLKQVTYKNTKRKQILLPLLERQLAWQEYSSILNDLDKQVDQAYIKRIRVPKKKKKHTSSSSHSGHHGANTSGTTASQLAQQKAADSSLKSLLDKRQRWINKIGPLFDAPHIMKRIPQQSVFKDMEPDEEDEETDVFEQEAVGKEEELTQN